MPEQRFFTPDGQPPNGGIPPSMAFVPVQQLSQAAPPSPNQPPAYYPYFAPPAYQPAPPPQAVHHYHHGIFSPQQLPNSTSSLAAPMTGRPPSPPGTRLNGQIVNLEPSLGFGYIFPENNTTVHFFYEGTQPWLSYGQLNYWKRMVPSDMTVRELIQRMGAPEGADDKNGITECIELGNGLWGQGRTFSIAGEASGMTVDAARLQKDGGGVVWLAVWTLP